MVQAGAIVAMVDPGKSYMVSQTELFSMTSTTPNPNFKVKPLYDADYLRNGTRYI